MRARPVVSGCADGLR